VADVAPFIDLLAAGDILLFDSVHPISGLIKFGENRPVNHAALYVGGDVFAQVTRHELGARAIQESSLTQRLLLRTDRTVTALRHKAAARDEGVGAAAATQSRAMANHSATYCYLDLITLIVPGLFRSYDRYLRHGGDTTRRLASMLEVFVPTLLSVLEADSAPERVTDGDYLPSLPQAAASLTCSEFVYRCYQEANPGIPIEVDDPLASWSLRWAQTARRAPQADDDLLDFHDGLTKAQDPSAADTPIVRGPRGVTRRQLASRACKTLLGLVRHNMARSKYGSIEPGTVVPDAVTPRDLLS
jgi:hypothetical protein